MLSEVELKAKKPGTRESAGMSASTAARKVGAAAPPDEGPRYAVLAVWLANFGAVRTPSGTSAVTIARNVGVAAPPEVGPTNSWFAVCVAKFDPEMALLNFDRPLRWRTRLL